MPTLPHLPPPPPAFQRIGWHGLALLLPTAWNLSLHSGHFSRGLLAFSDLRGPTFEIRWRTPHLLHLGPLRLIKKSPRRTLLRHVARLRRRHTVEPLQTAFFLPQKSLLLAADDRRLYELHWPRPSDLITPITLDFLTTLSLYRNTTHYLWSLYGLQGWLPTHARLRKTSLNPGQSHLTFHHRENGRGRWSGRGGTTTLGASALADRLLQNRTLKSWAHSTFPLIPQNSTPTQESRATLTYHVTTPHLFRHHHHEITIHHNPTLNLIHWTHTQTKKT